MKRWGVKKKTGEASEDAHSNNKHTHIVLCTVQVQCVVSLRDETLPPRQKWVENLRAQLKRLVSLPFSHRLAKL